MSSNGAERLANRKPIKKPVPAYLPSPGSVLTVDKTLYTAIREAPRELIEEFTLPIRSGKAWKAPAGSIVKISTPEGPQVGDLNIWNAHNPRERFWASRTKQLHASHVSTYDRLWSNLPYMRPLATIITDSLDWYGTDEHGGRVHDLLGTRCDPYINTILSGGQYNFQCTCPGGDLSLWGFGEDSEEEMIKCCRPLKVEVYRLKDETLLQKNGWKPAEVSGYKGRHGLDVPLGENREEKA
ncbi:hypothetical protein IL306_006223 [Fusarium sp. DS 682]|nr:hypothetical protein IL306_006223 [Fusarium sp. DS 682]